MLFQLTAARRRLVENEDNLFKMTLVSTHSRPKAAGFCNVDGLDAKKLFQLTAARRRLAAG